MESTNQASEISNQKQEGGASKKSGLFYAIKMWGLIGSTGELLVCITDTVEVTIGPIRVPLKHGPLVRPMKSAVEAEQPAK